MIIWSIAKTTVGDAMRKKVLQIFLVVAIGLIVISLSFSKTLSFSTRGGASTDIMMIKAFGLGLMSLGGFFISLIMGVMLIPQEIERRTIYTILSKPVNRYEFIIGKFLGAILTLAINIGLMGAVFMVIVMLKAWGAEAGAGNYTDIKDAAAAAHAVGIFDWNMVWGIVLIYLQVMVLSSVVLLFSIFMTPTVNFFMGAGVYVLGSMSPLTETFMKAEGASGFLKGLYWVIYHVLPNFDTFNKPNALLHPESTQLVSLALYTFKASMYGVLYALVMMTVAVIIFNKKEV